MHERTVKGSAVRVEKISNETKSALRSLDVFQKLLNFLHMFSTHHIVAH